MVERLEPFKYPGCKAGLAPQILAAIGTVRGTYREPFLGSGAIFHHAVEAGLVTLATLSDADPWIVRAHREFDEPDALDRLAAHRLATWTARYFEAVRARVNYGRNPGWAGDFIALQAAAFNGVYRRNADGASNVPWAKKAKPPVPSVERLVAAASRRNKAAIFQEPAVGAVHFAIAGDVVYLDPPYVGEVWSAYGSAQTFRAEDLEAVIAAAVRAVHRGVRVVLSHTDTPWVREQLVGWTITTVSTPSRLSPNAKTRGTREEIIAVIGGEA